MGDPSIKLTQFLESLAGQFDSVSAELQLKPYSRVVPHLDLLLSETPKRVLIIAPHPDDECFMSGLALRLKEESGASVEVVPFSYGSDLKRRPERLNELKAAVNELNFTLITDRFGLDPLSELSEAALLQVLKTRNPDALFLPHLQDGHPTHIRCANIGRSSAKMFVQTSGKRVDLFFTELWASHPVSEPANLLIPLAEATVGKMMKALSQHKGEVKRNPYPTQLIGVLMDQARRGSELSAFGSTPVGPYLFGQLLRLEQLSF